MSETKSNLKQVLFLSWAVLSVAASVAGAAELATVNGKPITSKDIDAALATLNEGQRSNLLKDPGAKRQVLKNVIDQELLVQEAEKKKLDQEPEFKDAMNAFRKQYLSNRLLQKELGPESTEKAAKKYYEDHKLDFSTDQVHAQHILVPTEKEAKEMMVKAKEPDADFLALAEKYSKDNTAKNNRGDIGFFTRDGMVPEFTGPVFAASEGFIIGPIRTSFGYHVVKIIEHKIGHTMNYSEVELKVKNQLNQVLVQRHVAKAREGAKITINEKALDRI